MARQIPPLRDERLLVGIAVRDERAVGPDDQRKAVRADADLIDHLPHFFEAEFADKPAVGPIEARQVHREDRRGQQVFVHVDRRHLDSVERHLGGAGRHGHTRLARAARRDHCARFVEERDFAELAELQDVVLENAILLPALEAGVLQVGRDGLQQFRVGRHVAPDLLGGPGGDIEVARDDGVVCALLKGSDGGDAIGDQGHGGGRRQDQRKARRDVPNPDRHSAFSCCPAGRLRWDAKGAAYSRTSPP